MYKMGPTSFSIHKERRISEIKEIISKVLWDQAEAPTSQ